MQITPQPIGIEHETEERLHQTLEKEKINKKNRVHIDARQGWSSLLIRVVMRLRLLVAQASKNMFRGSS
jgi:hypothetical protein